MKAILRRLFSQFLFLLKVIASYFVWIGRHSLSQKVNLLLQDLWFGRLGKQWAESNWFTHFILEFTGNSSELFLLYVGFMRFLILLQEIINIGSWIFNHFLVDSKFFGGSQIHDDNLVIISHITHSFLAHDDNSASTLLFPQQLLYFGWDVWVESSERVI